MRTALFAAGLALVAGTTLGCGGGDKEAAEVPPSASKEEFCGAFEDFYAEVSAIEQGDTAQRVDAIKAFGQELDDLGVPEGTPEDARQGFDVTVDAIADIPDDATEEDLAAIDEGFSQEETEQSDAFNAYLTETCESQSESP